MDNFSGSPGLEQSQARVTYLDNWGGLRELRAPSANPGGHTWWKVLELDVSMAGGRPNPTFTNTYVSAEDCDTAYATDL